MSRSPVAALSSLAPVRASVKTAGVAKEGSKIITSTPLPAGQSPAAVSVFAAMTASRKEHCPSSARLSTVVVTGIVDAADTGLEPSQMPDRNMPTNNKRNSRLVFMMEILFGLSKMEFAETNCAPRPITGRTKVSGHDLLGFWYYDHYAIALAIRVVAGCCCVCVGCQSCVCNGQSDVCDARV